MNLKLFCKKAIIRLKILLLRFSIRFIQPSYYRLITLMTRKGLIPSRAVTLSLKDNHLAAHHKDSFFSLSTRPVIRWVKGPGNDDEITRAAVGQATRLFGNRVDYCICSNGISAERMRTILELAVEPVEWRPVSPTDNLILANKLAEAGCPPENYGYWWKWFPERIRKNAPEWILDGDMVITAIPPWFDRWAHGKDCCRVTQDDRWPIEQLYGRYLGLVDEKLRLYSGLISLPPHQSFMDKVKEILDKIPLKPNHDGRHEMCEQGVVAAVFQQFNTKPIPLHEFPFARSFEENIDYGVRGNQNAVWGYHFGNAFKLKNKHFEALTKQGIIFSCPTTSYERFGWLQNRGQWGIPGWSMAPECLAKVVKHAQEFKDLDVLEIGSSRGYLSAILSSIGCRLTTIDIHDRGARQNLEGLNVDVIVDDVIHFLSKTTKAFDCIVVDLHDNSENKWKIYAPLLQKGLARSGSLIINNAALYKIPEWGFETGVDWFIKNLPPNWTYELYEDPVPGVAIVRN